MTSTFVYYTGTNKPPPTRTPLRAGKLALFFEQGDVRHIRYGEREVLRRVYVAVRDRNWGTLPAQISDLAIETGEDVFRITFEALCTQDDIAFRWRGAIKGEADSTLTFAMDGEALSEFWRNRIGFCVLHPIAECAGQPCVVTHSDGAHEHVAFPRAIAPHQPFVDMRAIAHTVAPGVEAEVSFAGDVFEMEDQRNWSDASFKTYGTPLALPFPVLVKAGERVQQQVRVRISESTNVRSNAVKRRRNDIEQTVNIDLADAPRGRLPAIGLGQASHGRMLDERAIERLRALKLAHLRADVTLADADFPDALRRTEDEAAALGTKLELALHLMDAPEDELRARRSLLQAAQVRTARYLILRRGELCTRTRWVVLARKILGTAIPIGAGADSNFTELNREPPDMAGLDFVFYAANPQVHANDTLSLVENLAGLGETLQSAHGLANGKPIVVSPVTLKARFNVVATVSEPESVPDVLPKAVDVRQLSLFGAGWTLGSLKYLAQYGAMSVTYYETTGWCGVMETATGSSNSVLFPSLPGSVFPLYHVLAAIGAFAGGTVLTSFSSNPLRVESLVLSKDGRTRVLVANLDARPVRVRLGGLPSRASLKLLDETTVLEAMQSPESYRARPGDEIDATAPLLLRPYAVAQLDVVA